MKSVFLFCIRIIDSKKKWGLFTDSRKGNAICFYTGFLPIFTVLLSPQINLSFTASRWENIIIQTSKIKEMISQNYKTAICLFFPFISTSFFPLLLNLDSPCSLGFLCYKGNGVINKSILK